MRSKKIIFRADGSQSIGMGHYVRCLAFAEMLCDDFYIIFATRFPTDNQCNEIYKICDELWELKDNHHDVFLEKLSGDEIVVLDNYFFDTNYQRAIKSKGDFLICIDDMHDKHYVADIVINHSLGFVREDYSLEPYSKLLVGLDWALLRSEFLNYTPLNIPKNNEIFICFGGTDMYNLSEKVIKASQNIANIQKINVVIGELCEHKESLEELIKLDNRITLYRNLSAAKMVDLMARSILGIVPAGGILWESVFIGLPCIYGYYVDNQVDICVRNGTKPGLYNINDFRTISAEQLSSTIINFMQMNQRFKVVKYTPKLNYTQLFKSIKK